MTEDNVTEEKMTNAQATKIAIGLVLGACLLAAVFCNMLISPFKGGSKKTDVTTPEWDRYFECLEDSQTTVGKIQSYEFCSYLRP